MKCKKIGTLSVVVLIFALAGVESRSYAARPWAPGTGRTSAESAGSSGGNSSMWLRFGPSVGTIDQSEIYPDNLQYLGIYDKMTMTGVSLEAGIRPVSSTLGNNSWALDIPFVVTAHQRELGFDNFKLTGQIIPTARIILGSEDRNISPFFGIGGGIAVHISDGNGLDNTFDNVLTYRLGCDAMMSKMMGFGLTYTHSSIKYSFDTNVSKSVGFGHIALSIILHP